MFMGRLNSLRHENNVCSGQVKLFYWFWDKLEPAFYGTHLSRVALSCFRYSQNG